MTNTFNARETATVLAALRYWQREGLMSGGHEHDIATDGETLTEMNASEIDALCESLNFGDNPTGEFIALIARMTMDTECQECHQFADEPNPECGNHESWELAQEDAFATLNDLIEQARKLEINAEVAA